MLVNYFTNSKKTMLIDLSPLLLSGENGGAKIFILDLIKGIINTSKVYEFTILCKSELHDFLKNYIHNEEISFIFLEEQISRSFWKKIKDKFLFFYTYDIYFAPFGFIDWGFRYLKLVSIIYDLQFKRFPYFFDDNELKIREQYLSLTLNKSDHIVCISKFTKSELSFFYPNYKNVSVIYLRSNFFNINKSISKSSSIKTNFLLYPANMWPHKNHKLLLTAYTMYLNRCTLEKIKPLQLILTGEALGFKHQIIDLCNKNSILKNNLLYLEFIEREELLNLYQDSSALIFPSLYEGFGMPIIEALSLNKPIICSDIPVFKEILKNNAIYFDPRKPQDICIKILEFHKSINKIKSKFDTNKIFSNFECLSKSINEYMKIFENLYL